jgi:hypothetical protein
MRHPFDKKRRGIPLPDKQWGMIHVWFVICGVLAVTEDWDREESEQSVLSELYNKAFQHKCARISAMNIEKMRRDQYAELKAWFKDKYKEEVEHSGFVDKALRYHHNGWLVSIYRESSVEVTMRGQGTTWGDLRLTVEKVHNVG